MPESPLTDTSPLFVVTEQVIETYLAQGVTNPKKASHIQRFQKGQVVSAQEIAAVEARGVTVPVISAPPGARPCEILDLDGTATAVPEPVGPGITTDSLAPAEPEAADEDEPEVAFDPKAFHNIEALEAFAAEQGIDLGGATKRADIEAAIAAALQED